MCWGRLSRRVWEWVILICVLGGGKVGESGSWPFSYVCWGEVKQERLVVGHSRIAQPAREAA